MKFLGELEAELKSQCSPQVAAQIIALAKPAIVLQKRFETIKEETPPLFGLFKRSPKEKRRGLPVAPGTSRIGGLPELPEGQPWPSKEGVPMQFLAQINCVELIQFRETTLLPESGMLHFFLASDGMESMVTLTRSHADLKTVAPPDNAKSQNFILPQFPVEFVTIPTFPHPESRQFGALNLREEDTEAFLNAYGEIIEKIRREQHGLHQIGGYPEAVQGDVFTECEKDNSEQKQTWEQAAEKAHCWRLLFQCDTDDDLDVMWGDAGTVYFCIRENDLRTGKFDKVCSTMQCG